MIFSSDDTDRLFELLRWRRDVRHFQTKPLREEELSKLKNAMHLAPSVGNSRPWRVVSVASPQSRERVIENFNRANDEAAQLYDGQKLDEYRKLKLAGLREAPVHLAVFTDPDPEQGHGLGRQTMPQTLEYSTVAAIHQLWLVARTMNIGVGWVSILNDKEINEILNVSKSWILTGYLCVGYPAESSDEPELQREGWQENQNSDWLSR